MRNRLVQYGCVCASILALVSCGGGRGGPNAADPSQEQDEPIVAVLPSAPKEAPPEPKDPEPEPARSADSREEWESREAPRPPPDDEETEDDGGVVGGVVGGVPGGVVGGVPGGVVGGVVGGTLGPVPPHPGDGVIPFGAGMNRPVLLSGKDPVYTKEALAAGVEGIMIVRCTIKKDGSVTNCRVIKSLPHLDKVVIPVLTGRRYSPVLYQGQPVNVDYVFNLRFKLPEPPPPPPPAPAPALPPARP